MPIVVTIFAAAALFFITYFFDYYYHGAPFSAWHNFFRGNANTFRYSITAAATALAATLGIMIAIVLLIVQLTANRYTPKAVDLFITHKANLFLISVFIISIIYSIWVSHTINEDYIPRYGGLVVMTLMTLCYTLIIPYFLYLFNMLKPTNIINQIREEAVDAIYKLKKNPSYDLRAKHIINTRLEQITDIALSAVQRMDSEITHHCVWALQSMVDTYLRTKKHLHKGWYKVDQTHIFGASQTVIDEVVKIEAWVEFRAMRQMMQVFTTTSGGMLDISSAVAQAYRSIGTTAAECGDKEVIDLVIRFFNTLLKHTVITNCVRANNDTLYQYRLFAERIIETYSDFAKTIAYYLSHYAILFVGHGGRQNFESAVYDLRKLNERANKKKIENAPEFLLDFLELQYKLDYYKHPGLVKSLWKSYAILASFFLLRENTELARKIYDHMKRIPLETVLEMKMEILSANESHFWEITDRVISYNYTPPKQREKLEEFFDWFLVDLGIIGKDAIAGMRALEEEKEKTKKEQLLEYRIDAAEAD